MNYSFTNILSSNSIGDTRSTMNANYSAIDAWMTSFQLSAQNYWIPLMNYYNSIKVNLQNNITTGSTYKQNWDNMVTLVKTNTSRWIEPLILFYPEKIKLSDLNGNKISNKKYKDITNWLSDNFLITDQNDNTIYIDNQKAYIYLIKEKSSTSVHTVQQLLDSTNCSTVDQTQCIQCTTKLVGYVYCSNGNLVCSGTSSCPHCESVDCYYMQSSKEYNSTSSVSKNPNYNPKIEAWINLFYKDLGESTNISCLKYIVKNCDWLFLEEI
jgi:hypothetical protein